MFLSNPLNSSNLSLNTNLMGFTWVLFLHFLAFC
uniref:Uncharacterized protein n=1 Tax=Rhizophora mucronata TaxID=61149 RepID=A0A2P2QMQ6_RHIMU